MLGFAAPSFLLLAPAAAAIVLLAVWRARSDLSRPRRVLAAAVRILAVLLLAGALAGPYVEASPPLRRLTVFLLDVSDSAPREALQAALAALEPWWNREVAAGHRCALVRFAGRAEVAVPPGAEPLRPDPARWLAADLEPGRTALRGALDAAQALFDEDFAPRLVLLGDGREADPEPGLIEIPLLPFDSPDVAVLAVDAPLAVRRGEPFDARVTVLATGPGDLRLSFALDDLPLPEAALKVRLDRPGRHVIRIPNLQQKEPFAPGPRRLLAVAEFPGDVERRNNVGAAPVTITGTPRVLLVEGAPLEGDFLAGLLKAQDIELVRRTPAEWAGEPEEDYVAVVLAGVPREALPPAALEALKTRVEQSGAGLWLVGSPALDGPRGHAGGPLEGLLPVRFVEKPSGPPPDPAPAPPPPPPAPPPPVPDLSTPPQAKRVLAPTAALLLVVDKSGSMAGRNIEIVKEACLAAAKALSPTDLIGVLAFDAQPRWVLEFTEAERQDYIQERILRLLADGGTNIQPALVEAFRAFELDGRARRCALRHVVLLSDGETPPADFETVVRAMTDAGITVSTVCVAAARFDATLMGQIAAWGRGRFKFTDSFRNVPALIVNETRRIVSLIPKEGPPGKPPQGSAAGSADPPPPVPPAPRPGTPEPRPSPQQPVLAKDDHEVLGGFAGQAFPALLGRLEAEPRPGAVVPLATTDGKPVLALGRLGLGKTAAWTSDFAGGWSAAWRDWPETGKLAAQVVRYLSGPGPDADLAALARIREHRLEVDPSVEVRDAATGAPFGDAPPSGRVLLRKADGKSLLVSLQEPYSAEFRPVATPGRRQEGAASWEDLHGRLGEGRREAPLRREAAPWLLALAALLLPIDVALRRVAR